MKIVLIDYDLCHTKDGRSAISVNDRARSVPLPEDLLVATNPPKGDGHRNGAVRDRSQVQNPTNDNWTKRDTATGRFMDQKQDGKPFKGVRKEK